MKEENTELAVKTILHEHLSLYFHLCVKRDIRGRRPEKRREEKIVQERGRYLKGIQREGKRNGIRQAKQDVRLKLKEENRQRGKCMESGERK